MPETQYIKNTVFGKELLFHFLSTLFKPDDANHVIYVSAALSPLSYLCIIRKTLKGRKQTNKYGRDRATLT